MAKSMFTYLPIRLSGSSTLESWALILVKKRSSGRETVHAQPEISHQGHEYAGCISGKLECGQPNQWSVSSVRYVADHIELEESVTPESTWVGD